MRYDLHCHSYYSDGAHTPEFLLQRAINNGLSHLAITDHDCIDACQELAGHTATGAIELITGVEISSQLERQEIHVIGLGIDLRNESLAALLALQQRKRKSRISSFDALLTRQGITGLQEHMEKLPTRAPGRTQVADFLVLKGLCRDHRGAFQRYLGRQGKCYVAADWCAMAQAIEVIKAAGGIPVLAHPHRYATSTSGLRRLLSRFQQLGGEGMEVACGNLDKPMLEKLGRLGEETGLYASTGSDFHSSKAVWTDIGKVPELPDSVKKNAIWTHPRWHS
ncbi:MAG: PHP domain-containing protein [Pseudohongiellaceae bacterium]